MRYIEESDDDDDDDAGGMKTATAAAAADGEEPGYFPEGMEEIDLDNDNLAVAIQGIRVMREALGTSAPPEQTATKKVDSAREAARRRRKREFLEWSFRALNALVCAFFLGMLAVGIHLEVRGIDASYELLHALGLANFDKTWLLFAQWPAIFIGAGAIGFLLSLATVLATGWGDCSNAYYTAYSLILVLLSACAFTVVTILHLSARSTEQSNHEKISILGHDITMYLEILWVKLVADKPENVCEFEGVMKCSGFKNYQCDPGNETIPVHTVVGGCPGQKLVMEATGSTQALPSLDEVALENVTAQVGFDVGACLRTEAENLHHGCLFVLTEVIQQLGKELFVPGLFVASYTLILSILAAVLLFYKFSRKDLRLPR